MKRWVLLASAALALVIPTAAATWGFDYFKVVARESDPGRTFLVQAEWLTGIGCPHDAKLATPNASFTGVGGFRRYGDPACPPATSDRRDQKNTGLLLAKTGPTISNFAAAVADIKGAEGKTLTQLGYDIRKPGLNHTDPRGSWCGAGAPRFNVETTDGFWFIGCNSPPPTTEQDGDGFMRLTWGGVLPLVGFEPAAGFALTPVTGQVKRLQIVFDEGTTVGSFPPTDVADHAELGFGLAVLDNINVNGVRVGQGPGEGDDDDEEEADDDGDSPRHCDDCKRRNGYDD